MATDAVGLVADVMSLLNMDECVRVWAVNEAPDCYLREIAVPLAVYDWLAASVKHRQPAWVPLGAHSVTLDDERIWMW
jgi:hypothetical protein